MSQTSTIVPDDPGCCPSPEIAPTWTFGVDAEELDGARLPSDERFVSGWRCSECGEVGDSDGN